MIAVEVAMGPLYRYTTPLGGQSFLRRGGHVADVAHAGVVTALGDRVSLHPQECLHELHRPN